MDICQFCQTNKISKRSTKFCSFRCQQDHQQKEIIDLWLAGETLHTTGVTLQIRKTIRRYLIQLAGEKCSKCGWCEINPVTMRPPLEVNHIDGNPENGDISNLEVLCPNCHALTPNFRALNKKSPRVRKPKKIKIRTPKVKITKEKIPYVRKCKICWPSPEEIAKWVWQRSTSTIAKQLGVSDKAVEKFCKKNNISKPPRGYWMKQKSEPRAEIESAFQDYKSSVLTIELPRH
jgi:hypothetical protein